MNDGLAAHKASIIRLHIHHLVRLHIHIVQVYGVRTESEVVECGYMDIIHCGMCLPFIWFGLHKLKPLGVFYLRTRIHDGKESL